MAYTEKKAKGSTKIKILLYSKKKIGYVYNEKHKFRNSLGF
jgi:hypothetical protein